MACPNRDLPGTHLELFNSPSDFRLAVVLANVGFVEDL
jgi:hypothetical protein